MISSLPFFESGEISSDIQRVLSYSVRLAGIGIWNPVETAETLFLVLRTLL